MPKSLKKKKKDIRSSPGYCHFQFKAQVHLQQSTDVTSTETAQKEEKSPRSEPTGAGTTAVQQSHASPSVGRSGTGKAPAARRVQMHHAIPLTLTVTWLLPITELLILGLSFSVPRSIRGSSWNSEHGQNKEYSHFFVKHEAAD